MAKLATCPGCTTQLALPEDATLSDRARCPRCHEEFLLMETVQFSIPTAEILSPPEPPAFAPADNLSHFRSPLETTTESVTDSDSDTPEYRDEIQSSGDEPPSLTDTDLESEPAPLPASATLSDWEARLKRAIAADVDDEEDPAAPLRDKPLFDFSDQNLGVAPSADQVANEVDDFAVPDADLMPEIETAEVTEAEEQSVATSYLNDDEATLNFTGDQTIAIASDRAAQPDDPEPLPHIDDSMAVRSNNVTPRKNGRSPLRTLVSASLGVVGIPIGLYVLLWLRGPAGDMLNIAQYLPSFLLPAEFNGFDADRTERIAREPSTTNNDEPPEVLIADNGLTAIESHPERPILQDHAVSPASAEQVAYEGPTFALVDAAEFDESLAAAQQIASQLTQGDLKTKDSVASKGQAYMALARLADKCAFLNQPGRTPADIASAQAAVQFFHTVLRDDIVQRDLPQIALRWWQYADRPSPGFVLIGTVNRVQPEPVGRIVFVVPGGDASMPEIPILLGNAEPVEGEQIAIVGVIETNPQLQLPSLEPSLGPVAIAHYSFPVHDTGE